MSSGQRNPAALAYHCWTFVREEIDLVYRVNHEGRCTEYVCKLDFVRRPSVLMKKLCVSTPWVMESFTFHFSNHS
jgi:hypothetical protein